jgi:predicted esterase YcpF (UPF0227 family)
MKILYLHGFCARLNGRKASCLRSHFGESAVIEPAEPGLPYGKELARPVLERLGEQLKKKPQSLLGLFGPNRMAALHRLTPELAGFFTRSIDIAQQLYDTTRPDIIVGSSLGGSVAMAIDSRSTPMVLIGPVWNQNIKAGISADNIPNTGGMKRLVLSAATSALRGPVARFAGFKVPARIQSPTLILHSAHDEIFDLSHSRILLQKNLVSPGDSCHEPMQRVVDRLTEAGFANDRSTEKNQFNDGRLIVIGKDHHTNEPDPLDRRNKDPHPHSALVTAVRVLLEEFGGR